MRVPILSQRPLCVNVRVGVSAVTATGTVFFEHPAFAQCHIDSGDEPRVRLTTFTAACAAAIPFHVVWAVKWIGLRQCACATCGICQVPCRMPRCRLHVRCHRMAICMYYVGQVKGSVWSASRAHKRTLPVDLGGRAFGPGSADPDPVPVSPSSRCRPLEISTYLRGACA